MLGWARNIPLSDDMSRLRLACSTSLIAAGGATRWRMPDRRLKSASARHIAVRPRPSRESSGSSFPV